MSSLPPEVGTIEEVDMAVAVNTGEVVQVLVQYTIEEQECENVLYFRAQAADTDMLAHLLLQIAQCLLTAIIPHLNSNFMLDRIIGKVVSPAVGLEETWTPAAGDAVQGAEAGDSEPSFVAALISLYTTRPGRSGRGRMYLGGVAEGDTTGSKINVESPLWTALAAFVACMLAQFHTRDVAAAGNYEWGVMSRKLGGAKAPFAAAGFAPITRAVPVQLLATVRRRKVGRGR